MMPSQVRVPMTFLSILLLAQGVQPVRAQSPSGPPASANTAEASPAAFAEGRGQRAQAPNFTLKSLKGHQTSLSDAQGKVLVLSFWASWCKPCIQELGFLKKLAAQHPDNLVVYGIATDAPDTMASVRRVVKRKRLNMPILFDSDGSVMGNYNPRGVMPFSAYIDRQGRIHSVHEGFSSGDEMKLTSLVEGLINEAARPVKK